jgi:chromosome segregation ATPase
LDDANSLLNKLKKYDYDIINEEYELYTNKNFLTNISLSKLDLSKKYLELLEKHKDDNEKFSKLKSQLEKVYNDETDVVHNELKTVKQKMVKYEEKVEKLVQIFTTYIDDKEVLHKVDEVSGQLKNSHRKLDSISHNIKNNNDMLIKSLLDGVIKTNRDLVVRVQKIYKNSKRDEEVVAILDTTTVDMSQGIDNALSKDDVAEVIKKCNFTLYKGIKRLYKRDNDSTKNDLFREALAVAEKRHQQHLVSLKRSLEEKREEVELLNKEISNLNKSIVSLKNTNMSLDEKIEKLTELESNYKKLKDKIKIDKDKLSLESQKKLESTTIKLEKEILELKSQLTLKEKDIELIKSQFREEIAMFNSWIHGLESEYKESKQQSQEISEKFSKLSDEKAKLEGELERFSTFDETKKNDIKLLIDKHKKEINELENLIEQWKGKTEQLSNLEESIKLSSETATKLIDLEKDYEDKIALIEDRFKKIKHNPKNEKRLKEIFKEILIFENKLDYIKNRVNVYPIKNDSKITLHLLESDLEKIDDIIKKRYSLISSVYSKIRFFIISVIVFIFIVILLGLGKGM